jgi:hypothetical protein
MTNPPFATDISVSANAFGNHSGCSTVWMLGHQRCAVPQYAVPDSVEMHEPADLLHSDAAAKPEAHRNAARRVCPTGCPRGGRG